MIPSDFQNANRGIVKDIKSDCFVLELEFEPDGILRSNYCEFYTPTKYGTLFFQSYAKEINGKSLVIASPAKHKFLQRRQYTRIKYILDTDLFLDDLSHKITILDISAGGMKFKTRENVNIEKDYKVTLPLSEEQSVTCHFSPIRIEKNSEDGYTISGRYEFDNNRDKMMLIQYCAKRSIEIKNK